MNIQRGPNGRVVVHEFGRAPWWGGMRQGQAAVKFASFFLSLGAVRRWCLHHAERQRQTVVKLVRSGSAREWCAQSADHHKQTAVKSGSAARTAPRALDARCCRNASNLPSLFSTLAHTKSNLFSHLPFHELTDSHFPPRLNNRPFFGF